MKDRKFVLFLCLVVALCLSACGHAQTVETHSASEVPQEQPSPTL